MLIDYHLHNRFSPDSESETAEIAKRAVELGISEICITNHIEGGEDVFIYKEAINRFREIGKEIEEVQSQFPNLPIKFGAELEYVKEWMQDMKRLVLDMDFDFLIGSMHIVDGVIISSGSKPFADPLYSRNPEEYAYGRYFELLYDMVKWGEFDVVGHFDICKKSGFRFYGPFNPQKYKSKIMDILQLMKKKGIGIELNTNCVQEKCKELFPHPDILKWCLETGIEHYTLGSDAHEVKAVGRHLKESLAIAKDIGIPSISTYEKRQAKKHKI